MLPVPNRRSLMIAGGGAAGLAIAVTAILAIDDALRGPDLVGGHAATVESVFLAVLGSTLTIAWRSTRPRLWRSPQA